MTHVGSLPITCQRYLANPRELAQRNKAVWLQEETFPGEVIHPDCYLSMLKTSFGVLGPDFNFSIELTFTDVHVKLTVWVHDVYCMLGKALPSFYLLPYSPCPYWDQGLSKAFFFFFSICSHLMLTLTLKGGWILLASFGHLNCESWVWELGSFS